MTRLRPFIAAGTVGATGFGAMNFLWSFSSHSSELKGLYHYVSSTLGDGLFLPLAAGSIEYARAQLHSSEVPSKLPLLAGAFSGALAIATQISWLADPNIDPNWTIPAPHTFTVAGWYHAAFSVGVSAYLGWVTADTAKRAMQGNTPLNRGFRTGMVTAILSSIAFAASAAYDNADIMDRSASQASVTALMTTMVLVVGIVVAVLARRR